MKTLLITVKDGDNWTSQKEEAVRIQLRKVFPTSPIHFIYSFGNEIQIQELSTEVNYKEER